MHMLYLLIYNAAYCVSMHGFIIKPVYFSALSEATVCSRKKKGVYRNVHNYTPEHTYTCMSFLFSKWRVLYMTRQEKNQQ